MTKGDRDTDGLPRGQETSVRTGVDLGLAGLLAASDEPPQSSQSDSREPLPNEALGGESPPSEFEVIAREGRWQELIMLAERKLHPHASESGADDATEARLWWVRGQLALQAMPAAILTAPFESCLREVEANLLKRPAGVSDRRFTALRDLAVAVTRLMLEEKDIKSDRELAAAFQGYLDRLGVSEAAGRRGENSAEDGPHARSPIPRVAVPKAARQQGVRMVVFVFLIAAALLGAGVVLSGGHTLLSALNDGSEQALAIPLESPSLHGALEIPHVSSVTALSKFDTLLYEVSQRESRNVQAQGAAAAQAPVESGAEASLPSKVKETVDTRGPIEGERVQAREPSPQRGEVAPGIQDGPSPFDMRDMWSRDGKTGGGRTQDFRRPVPYHVIVRTAVFSSPSVRSRVVAELDVGDEILGEGIEDVWLRVRSRSGREGFVRLQDLERGADW